MQVYGEFNNVSQELLNIIPEFKEGEIKCFQMLNGVVNNDPDYEERMKQPIFYGGLQIPCVCKIKDPFHSKDVNGNWISKMVDIGLPVEFDNNGRPTKYKLFIPGKGIGKFTLVHGNIDDEELYEYLWLCNYREGNKYADRRTEKIFEFIELVDADELTNNEIDMLTEALKGAQKFSFEDMKSFAAVLKWDTSAPEKNLAARIKEYAKTNSKEFLEVKNVVYNKRGNKKLATAAVT